ncbi:MAG: PAS domain-containing sensor histidine kinase [Candidatus Cyclobacteriaceae bacterium M3_2C_046]
MKKPYKKNTNFSEIREKIIGLGEKSTRKSYYVELQEKLKQLEGFKRMVNGASDSIFIIRLDNYQIIDMNESARGLVQQESEVITFESVLTCFEEKVRKNITAFLSASDQEREIFIPRAKMMSLSGQPVWVNLKIHKDFYEQEEHAVLFVRDITDQIKASKKLNDVNDRFKLLLENVPLRIYYKDKNLVYQSCNQNYAKDLHIQPAEIKGKTDMDFFPAQLARAYQSLDQLVLEKDVMMEQEEPYFINQKKFFVQTKKAPVKNSKGRIIGVLGVITDITKKKETEEALKTRNEELNNFVYKVSHDLRAPLASIKGLVQLLKIDHPEFNENQYISYINDRIDKLDFFIRDILAHSRNLNTPVIYEEVDLAELIQQCLADLAYLPESAKTNLKLDHDQQLVMSDPLRLTTVFSNLISNSIRYRNSHQPQIKIRIKWTVKQGKLHLLYQDNSLGIDQAIIEKVFNMFYRGNENSTGSGIGLYIVQQVIKKLEGTISLSSKPNQGIRFNITLPVKPDYSANA